MKKSNIVISMVSRRGGALITLSGSTGVAIVGRGSLTLFLREVGNLDSYAEHAATEPEEVLCRRMGILNIAKSTTLESVGALSTLSGSTGVVSVASGRAMVH